MKTIALCVGIVSLVCNITDINNKKSDTYNLNCTYNYDNDCLIANMCENINGRTVFNTFESNDRENFVNEANDFFAECKICNLASKSMDSLHSIYHSDYKKAFKPYGYVKFHIELKAYDFSNESSLYFLETKMEFIPGMLARQFGESGYEDYIKASKKDNLISIMCSQSEVDMGFGDIVYGGKPILKDCYPVSKPEKIAITSSYSNGQTIGISGELGFETKIGVNIEQSIVHEYSKTSTTTDPRLISGSSFDDGKYNWLLENLSESRDSINYNFGYIFEMNTYNSLKENVYGHVDMMTKYKFPVCMKNNKNLYIIDDFFTRNI